MSSSEFVHASQAPMPKKYEVNITTSDPDGEQPVPTRMAEEAAQKSPARWAYERLVMYIQEFEKSLDAEHEAAMGFTGGDAGVIRIEGMGYFDPDIVTFYGSDGSGVKTQMIQHVTQLNVVLRALPKPKEHVEAQRIGFRLAQDMDAEVG